MPPAPSGGCVPVSAGSRRPPRRRDARRAPPTAPPPPAARPPAGKGNQLGDDRVGQSVGRAPHQRAVGQAGQQRRFGLADRLSRVVVPHSPACPPVRLFDRLLRIALRAVHRRRSVRPARALPTLRAPKPAYSRLNKLSI